jgi:hypothetical protein
MLDLTFKALLVELLVFIQVAIPRVGDLERRLVVNLFEWEEVVESLEKKPR